MKQKEIAQKDGDNDAQKEAEKEISIQKKNKKEAQQREKEEDNNSVRPMRLTKKLISLNEWLTESSNPEPKEAPESSSNVQSDVSAGDGLSQEIDTILDKLKDLEDSIDESVVTSINEMNPVAFIKDWMKSGKVKSMQMQANKLKISQADMQLASRQEGLDDKKKEMIKQKLDGMGDQIDQIEDSVDQMAEGPMSSKAASITRAQGNLKVTKLKLKGADGKGKASLKARMEKINKTLNDEIAAMKELADKNKDNIKDAKQKKKDGELPGPDDGQKKKNSDKKKELKADRREKDKKKKEDAGKSDDEKKNDAKKKQIDDQVARLEKKVKGAKKALSNPNVPDAKKGEIQKNIDKLEKQIADQKAKLGGKKPAAKKPAAKKPAAPPPPPSKEKQKKAGDALRKKDKENVAAADKDQKKSMKDTEDAMKKQNDDAMKKGQKDIDKIKQKKDGPKAPPPIPGKEKKKDGPKAPPPIPGKKKKKKKKDEETNDSYNYSSEDSILLEGALLETVSANLFLIEQELDTVIENINSNIERV
jgi:DNA repair exonuclease SbcCD ATPase subunit